MDSSQLKTGSIYILLQTAACMEMLKELRQAAEVYEHSMYPLHRAGKWRMGLRRMGMMECQTRW
jgi:hypothetical protein